MQVSLLSLWVRQSTFLLSSLFPGTSLNLTVPASIDGDVVVAVGATLHLAHRLALFGDFTLQRGATLSLSADAFLGVGSFLNVSDGALIEFSLLDRQLRAITTANCVHLSGTLRIHVHSEKAVTTTVLSYACRIGEFTSLESVTDDPCWPNHEEAHYSDFDLVVSTVPYYRCDPPSLLPGITYQPALALVIVLALIAAVIFVAVTFVLFRALYNKVEKMQIEERHQESEKRQAKIAALKRRLSSRFSLDPDVLAPYV